MEIPKYIIYALKENAKMEKSKSTFQVCEPIVCFNF